MLKIYKFVGKDINNYYDYLYVKITNENNSQLYWKAKHEKIAKRLEVKYFWPINNDYNLLEKSKTEIINLLYFS